MSSTGPTPPETPVRVFVRPIASVLPLGFFAFGAGMFVLGVMGLGWAPEAESRSAGLLLVLFVFPLEFAAAILAVFARDTVGATVLGVFSGSWITLGVTEIVGDPGSTVRVDGFFLVFFAGIALALAAVAARGKPLIALLLVLSAVRSALDGAHQLGASSDVLPLAGAIALTLAAIALYGGLALALEAVAGRAVLPVFRRGGAREAMAGALGTQLDAVDREPGVRRQL